MDYPIKSTGLITVMLLSCSPAGSAADNPHTAESDDLPSLEFLDVLGSFETDSGEWIHPGELMQPEFEQLLESAENAPIQASEIDQQDTDPQSYDAANGDEV